MYYLSRRIMESLRNFKKNVYSQNGEDGVINEICRRLNMSNGEFVEFGAMDGKKLSNTYNLLSNNWTGVYIEGDDSAYEDLLKTKNSFPNQIQTIHSYVDYQGNKTLDKLLAGTSISKNFELLSIDIDSYDWQVWYSLKNYFPKIVIIEINSSIQPGILKIHGDNSLSGIKALGSSFSSTLALGKRKGYSLICHTGNMIFAKNELVKTLALDSIELEFPEILFDYSWCS